MFADYDLNSPGPFETAMRLAVGAPRTGPLRANDGSMPSSDVFLRALAVFMGTIVDEVPRMAADAQERARTRRAWEEGPDAALATIARTVPHGRARVVPPLRVAHIPYRGVEHAVVARPDLAEVVVGQAGGVPALLVPGTAGAVPHRLAAWLETQVLAAMRRYTDRYTDELGLERAEISLTNDSKYWGRCHMDAGRIEYSWTIVLAPVHVADYLAAHEVAHFVHGGHGRAFWKLTRRLCPATDKADAWLDANGAILRCGAR